MARAEENANLIILRIFFFQKMILVRKFQFTRIFAAMNVEWKLELKKFEGKKSTQQQEIASNTKLDIFMDIIQLTKC